MNKKRGAIIPNPIDTENTRKIVVCIPDTVEWLSLFTGLVSQLRYGWYWDRSTGDLDAIRDRAKRVYFEMQDQNGDCMALDCDEVADCIETSDNVKSALYELIQAFGGDTQGRPLPDSVMEQPLNNPAETCDLDALYGSAVQIIQSANRQIEDFLETIEAITNNQEALAEVFSFIPVLGDLLPIPEAISIVQKIREWLAEAYVAGYDLATETEYICALFCIGKLECEITAAQARDYFFAKAALIEGFEDAFTSVETLLTALANWQQSTGETVVEVMFGAAFGFMNFLNSMFGMDFASFVLKTRAGIPNDDWLFLCDDCAETEACFSTDSQYAVVVQGHWVNGYPDIQYAQSDAAGDEVEMRIVFPQNVELVSWIIESQSEATIISVNNYTLSLYDDADTLISTLYTHNNLDGGYIWHTVPGTTGATTVFRWAKLRQLHIGNIADIRLTVCVVI